MPKIKSGLKVNNLARLSTLLLLLEKPRHGYELFSEVEKRTGSRIGSSQVYPFLKNLCARGLLECKSTGSRGKKKYGMTAAGRELVKKTLSRFAGMLEAALGRKIRQCIHCGCSLYESGHAEKIGGKKLFFCCEHCAASYKKHGHKPE